MEQLLKSFGIEWKILIWQVINFAVLFLILSKFLYKPLKKIIAEREKKIAASLKDAEELKKKSKEIEGEFKKQMASQRLEIEEMNKKARQAQEKLRVELKEQAEKEAKRIIAEAKETALKEKEQIISGIETQVKQLAVALASKVLEKEIDEEKERRLLTETLEILKQKNLL